MTGPEIKTVARRRPRWEGLALAIGREGAPDSECALGADAVQALADAARLYLRAENELLRARALRHGTRLAGLNLRATRVLLEDCLARVEGWGGAFVPPGHYPHCRCAMEPAPRKKGGRR